MKINGFIKYVAIGFVISIAVFVVRQNFSVSDLSPLLKYTETIEAELPLVASAAQSANAAWSDYQETIEPGLLGYESDTTAANTAQSAIRTYKRRAENFADTLESISPPSQCRGFHIVLSEYSEIAQEHASSMTSYIEDLEGNGSVTSETQSRVNVAVNQVRSIADDISSEQVDCLQ